MTRQQTINPALGLGLAAVGLVIAGGAAAQQGGSDSWTHPTTEWGDPDLRGMWPIGHMIGTPLQRSPEFGNRREVTEEEFQRRLAQVEARNTRYEQEIESDKIGMGHWAEPTQATRLTSMVVEPEDGRLPEMTDAGKAKAAALGSSWNRDVFDRPEDFDTWDRCITRGMPASMFPKNYNNGIEIFQAPGYVVLNLEMIHEARIVPIDRDHAPEDVRLWMGDSRGRWEGNTLVVETTNFNGKAPMTNVGTPGSPRDALASSEELRIVERFTRVSDGRIDYEITVEDPVTLTRSWKAAYPWIRDEEYEFFEYACHEGNDAIRDFITTSRYERAQAAGE